MGYWGCAAGWGRIFTAPLTFIFSSIFNKATRMGSHFFGTLRARKFFVQKWLRWGLELATKWPRNRL